MSTTSGSASVSPSHSSEFTRGVEQLHRDDAALNLSTRALLSSCSSTTPITVASENHNSPLLQHPSLFIRSPAGLSSNSPLFNIPSTSPINTSRPPPPALLPATSLLSRPPLHLTHDLTLTPLSQFAKQQSIMGGDGSPLSPAQALSIMSNLHLAQSRARNAALSSPQHSEDGANPEDSDIEVTDLDEDIKINSRKHSRDETQEKSEESEDKKSAKLDCYNYESEDKKSVKFDCYNYESEDDCEAQDLRVKKRKSDFGAVHDANDQEAKDRALTAMQSDFMDLICRNSANAQCKQ